VNKAYTMDNASTGCMISEGRITNLQSYKGRTSKPIKHTHSFNHDHIEDVKSPVDIMDNL